MSFNNKSFILAFLYLLLGSCTFSQSINEPIDSLYAGLLRSLGWEKPQNINSVLVANLNEMYPAEPRLDTVGCSVYPVYIPGDGLSFEEIELEDFLRRENEPADYMAFLIDHDIRHSFHRVYLIDTGKVTKIEQLDMELNSDFSRVLSTSYYVNDRLVLIVDNYCKRAKNKLVIYTFNWSEDRKELLNTEVRIY
ncbi:MAG: hypothetical protein HUU54_11595 [Ignavibacteriaceae bacterium]|nr:hypothetical protein [Ignavibacteriaceae bacterium]